MVLTPSILVIASSADVRDRLVEWLNSSFASQRAAGVNELEKAIIYLAVLNIRVVLLDAYLPGKENLEAIRTIKMLFPGVNIIVINGLDNQRQFYDALAAGANAYIVDHQTHSDILPILTNLLQSTP